MGWVKLVGIEWVLSPEISLGAQEGQDFAVSSLDKFSEDKDLKATTVKVSADEAPGVTATYKGQTVSGGFATAETEPDNVAEARYDYKYVMHAENGNILYEAPGDYYFEKENTIEKVFSKFVKDMKDQKITVEVLQKVQRWGAVPGTSEAYLDYSLTVATPDFVFGDAKVAFGAAVADAGKNGVANVGLSAKASYANDQLSASVASDVVLAGVGDEV